MPVRRKSQRAEAVVCTVKYNTQKKVYYAKHQGQLRLGVNSFPNIDCPLVAI